MAHHAYSLLTMIVCALSLHSCTLSMKRSASDDDNNNDSNSIKWACLQIAHPADSAIFSDPHSAHGLTTLTYSFAAQRIRQTCIQTKESQGFAIGAENAPALSQDEYSRMGNVYRTYHNSTSITHLLTQSHRLCVIANSIETRTRTDNSPVSIRQLPYPLETEASIITAIDWETEKGTIMPVVAVTYPKRNIISFMDVTNTSHATVQNLVVNNPEGTITDLSVAHKLVFPKRSYSFAYICHQPKQKRFILCAATLTRHAKSDSLIIYLRKRTEPMPYSIDPLHQNPDARAGWSDDGKCLTGLLRTSAFVEPNKLGNIRYDYTLFGYKMDDFHPNVPAPTPCTFSITSKNHLIGTGAQLSNDMTSAIISPILFVNLNLKPANRNTKNQLKKNQTINFGQPLQTAAHNDSQSQEETPAPSCQLSAESQTKMKVSSLLSTQQSDAHFSPYNTHHE